jgi:hypothetical protein
MFGWITTITPCNHCLHTKHNASLKTKQDKRKKQETDGQLKVKENKEDSGYVDIATNL